MRFQIVKATQALNIKTAQVRSENQSAACGAALYRVGMLGFHKGGGGPLLALPQAVRGGYCPQKLLHLASQRRQGAGKMDFKKERMKETKLSKFFVCSLLT